MYIKYGGIKLDTDNFATCRYMLFHISMCKPTPPKETGTTDYWNTTKGNHKANYG